MCRNILILLLLNCLISIEALQNRVAVAGATGYIGRAVVKELVSRGVPTTALVRNTDHISPSTWQYLVGADIRVCNALDAADVEKVLMKINPTSVVCCLASRTGVKRDAWAIDYGGGVNLLNALKCISSEDSCRHFVLLSAFCVGKPLLQFQHAKLKLEDEIRNASPRVTHSIVRPTAYFKSLDGQLDQASKGNSVMFFGNGGVSANAIDDAELASYLSDCSLNPEAHSMIDMTRNIGGPDVPPVTKLEQVSMLYDSLNVPKSSRRFISLPLSIFPALISMFDGLRNLSTFFKLTSLAERFDDYTEIVRIVRYYAEEPMVAVGEGEVQGKVKLKDHFERVIRLGKEEDKYTTTSGVVGMLIRSEY